MRLIQIVPKKQFNLYGALLAKELELRRRGRGTLHRSGPKQHNRAKWKHSKPDYPGWIKLHRGLGGVVNVELKTKSENTEWQLLHSFLGFVDRHFADKVQSIHIQYE